MAIINKYEQKTIKNGKDNYLKKMKQQNVLQNKNNSYDKNIHLYKFIIFILCLIIGKLAKTQIFENYPNNI